MKLPAPYADKQFRDVRLMRHQTHGIVAIFEEDDLQKDTFHSFLFDEMEGARISGSLLEPLPEQEEKAIRNLVHFANTGGPYGFF